jgi:hypothetical protein
LGRGLGVSFVVAASFAVVAALLRGRLSPPARVPGP